MNVDDRPQTTDEGPGRRGVSISFRHLWPKHKISKARKAGKRVLRDGVLLGEWESLIILVMLGRRQ
ncbi:MAG: hypothetical protein DMG22_06015 [Acidobacteria bacterium]|nr:MAG: hypothetical protein DMG22_06015 [Acidobacteriota bacterium]